MQMQLSLRSKVVADTSSGELVLSGIVRGLVAGILFGIIEAVLNGVSKGLVAGVIFGVIMAVFFVGYLFYLRGKADHAGA